MPRSSCITIESHSKLHKNNWQHIVPLPSPKGSLWLKLIKASSLGKKLDGNVPMAGTTACSTVNKNDNNEMLSFHSDGKAGLKHLGTGYLAPLNENKIVMLRNDCFKLAPWGSLWPLLKGGTFKICHLFKFCLVNLRLFFLSPSL